MPLATPSAKRWRLLPDNPQRGLRNTQRTHSGTSSAMNAPCPNPSAKRWRRSRSDDKYSLARRPRLHERRAGLLVRLPMLQRQRDAAAG